jgi:hypothetical protein
MAGASPGWFPAPSPGDIVWCRFPQNKLSAPGPKARPALVLRVGEHSGHPVAEVAYGTSQRVDRLYSGEFAITLADQAAYEAAGLSEPTKFNLGATFELDFNDQWFAVPPGAPHGQTPRLGVLHPSLMRRAKAAFEAASAP